MPVLLRAAAFPLVLAALLGACADVPATADLHLDFRASSHGWVGGFAEFPVGREVDFQLVADHRALPEPLTGRGSGLYLSGANGSDDLFMFYAGPVQGLEPNRTLEVHFTVELATNAPRNCIGVGGAPGEGVAVKAGASTVQPRAVPHEGNWVMNVDIGGQSASGRNAVVLGDMANSRPCEAPVEWELKTVSGGVVRVTTDAQGTLWLFLGTDSGFEGTTNVYFTQVRARLEPAPALR